MQIREFIVNRIYELCDERRLSLTRLARLSALPPSTIKNIVNGASQNPGIVTIKKICDGLEISLIDFFNTNEFSSVDQEIK
ncbi:MAG: helix-turn-helix transcriptional regulator [Anaerolineaceae bacterium]|nr:helix-turn-helix transcriptional regulator [Anaerolineaceae bacterium]